ncbi:MAG: hypothetical protein QM756_12705 [Polyangiaceae bacterium]
MDQLDLKPGVNAVVGAKDTGKTGWLRTISFLLGDTDSPENALGAGIATKFDAARMKLFIDGTEELVLERRWKESGNKHKVFVNGERLSSGDFSEWIHRKLGIPILRFPKGNPYAGTWPELSWRMLFRHVYREERFWSDLADKQPEREQYACLLQFLGAAKKLYPEELGQEIKLRQDLLRLRARREQFDDVLQQAARGLLADASIATPTKDSITEGIQSLRSEIEQLRRQRDEILVDALSAQTGGTAVGLTLERELATQRTEMVSERDRLFETAQSMQRRLSELSTYRETVSAELTRIKRVEVAEELFRPLSVTRCPHCDQKVFPDRAAPGTCFVCHQQLLWESISADHGAKRRLAFEHDQLASEDAELKQLVDTLTGEQLDLDAKLRSLERTIAEVDVRLRSTRSAVAAVLPAGLEATHTRVGQLEERVAQLHRLQDTLAQRDRLAQDIESLEAKVQASATNVDDKSASVPFRELSEAISEGINDYLNQLKMDDARRWEHGAVQFQITDRNFKLLVGDSPWSSVGATSAGFVLLGYHYALTKLSGRGEFNYPGITLIDFPMTLADGTSIANKENYLIEPFVKLASANTTTQTVVCGRAFRNLKGANRIQLDEVWTQGETSDDTADARPPAGPTDLDLRIAAHFHSRHKQIMVVLDHAEVVRLAELLPDSEPRSQLDARGKVRMSPSVGAVGRTSPSSFTTSTTAT